MSHMLDCQLFGVQPGKHHIVNVLLHMLTACVLFYALSRMTQAFYPSAITCFIFALHPLRAESVAWIAERKDVLSGLLFALTLLAYDWFGRRPTALRYSAVLGAFALGLLAKPMLVTLPAILLLLDYWPLRRRWSLSLVLEKLPLAVLAAASVYATIRAQNLALGSTEYLPMSWRVSNAIHSYLIYVQQLFWPANLVPFYPHVENQIPVWQTGASVALLACITAVSVALRRRAPYLAVGWFWYLVMLVPVIGIVQVGLQGHADRYTYLPHIGLILGGVWAAASLADKSPSLRTGALVASVMIVTTLSALAYRQTGRWKNTETLWRYTLTVMPDSDVAHAGLAGFLLAHGDRNAAIDHYERAIQVRPGNGAAQAGLAIALSQRGDRDAAIEHFERSLEILPDNTEALNQLGVLYANKGAPQDAIRRWEQSLELDNENADACNNMAWILATSADNTVRDGAAAVRYAVKAVQLGGENPAVLRTLAAAYAENAQFISAVATAERGREWAEKSGDVILATNLRELAQRFRRQQPLRRPPQD